jgi:hypothetical protein
MSEKPSTFLRVDGKGWVEALFVIVATVTAPLWFTAAVVVFCSHKTADWMHKNL